MRAIPPAADVASSRGPHIPQNGCASTAHTENSSEAPIPQNGCHGKASILGNERFWRILVYSLEWSTILKNGWFPTWGQTYTSFDPTQHLMLSDVRPEAAPQPHLKIRLKAIKQDFRMERSLEAGGEDWVVVGDLADSNFSVFLWLRRLFGFFA
eukprot:4854972-Pleurochrysis_carterae.AAC.1